MVQNNLKEWDFKLPHAKFAYNRTPVRAIRCSLFKALYGINPLATIDLIPLPIDCKVSFEAENRATKMKKLHEQIRAHIEKVNEAYKVKTNKNRKSAKYQPGDLVLLHLRKERFPTKRKSKVIALGHGPFKVLAKAGTNVYKLKLPRDITVSTTFNVGDLSPYMEDDIDYGDLRANPFKAEEDDADQASAQDPQPGHRRLCLLITPMIYSVKENSDILMLV